MRRWMTVGLLTAAVLLPGEHGPGPRLATAIATTTRSDRGTATASRWGWASASSSPLNKTETYYMASLRIRTSGRGNDDRASSAGDEGITGYLEPEVGYWTSSKSGRPARGATCCWG